MMPREVTGAFARMAIAEEMIHEAFPSKDLEPRGLFLACRSPLLDGLTDQVYRAHVAEQIQRSRSRTPRFEEATEAEILAGLLQAATVAPLRTSGMVLADRLFGRVMGWRFEEAPTHEEWPGQFNEELTAARLPAYSRPVRPDLVSRSGLMWGEIPRARLSRPDPRAMIGMS